MSGKMKGLIGGGVALLALVLILVFTLGGKDDPVRELGEKYLSLGETLYEDLKKVDNKSDLKKIYKDAVSGFLQPIPEYLVLGKEDVEENYGGDWSKAFEDDEVPEEYKDLEKSFTAFGEKMQALEEDSEFTERMGKILSDMNEQDEKELINFTINELSKTGQAIANNPDALETANQLVKYMAKQFGGNADDAGITKNELLELMSDFKKTYSGLTGQEIFEREEVKGLMMFIALLNAEPFGEGENSDYEYGEYDEYETSQSVDICRCLSEPGNTDWYNETRYICRDAISAELGVDNWEEVSLDPKVSAGFDRLARECGY